MASADPLPASLGTSVLTSRPPISHGTPASSSLFFSPNTTTTATEKPLEQQPPLPSLPIPSAAPSLTGTTTPSSTQDNKPPPPTENADPEPAPNEEPEPPFSVFTPL